MTSHSSGLFGRLATLLLAVGDAAQPFVLLALRIFFGYALFRAGWFKITHLDDVTKSFAGLGIPMPEINALLVAVFEGAGGLLIMAGLATRVASGVLIVVLAVAASTAHRAELAELFSNPHAVLTAAPVPYIAVLLVLFTTGAGALSVDRAVAGRAR